MRSLPERWGAPLFTPELWTLTQQDVRVRSNNPALAVPRLNAGSLVRLVISGGGSLFQRVT
jgi:hypothetical protein